jgi:hypothetical protein
MPSVTSRSRKAICPKSCSCLRELLLLLSELLLMLRELLLRPLFVLAVGEQQHLDRFGQGFVALYQPVEPFVDDSIVRGFGRNPAIRGC